jgi:hypothetical protein
VAEVELRNRIRQRSLHISMGMPVAKGAGSILELPWIIFLFSMFSGCLLLNYLLKDQR